MARGRDPLTGGQQYLLRVHYANITQLDRSFINHAALSMANELAGSADNMSCMHTMDGSDRQV